MKSKKQGKQGLQAGLLGVGMALSQMSLAGGGSCSVARTGHCTACGGCIVVLTGLTGWALWRRASSSHADDDA
jgi:hypothetical protein